MTTTSPDASDTGSIFASGEVAEQWQRGKAQRDGINAAMFMIRVGTVRQRAELRPRTQHWCRSALDWVMDLHSVRQFAKQRTS